MISIIMPMYNESLEYIEESVKSILVQTYKKFELIIIIDNPSRIDLIDYVREIKSSDNRVRIIVNEKNLGLTASLNRGIDFATGEYIARMDADDIAMPDRLEKQLSYLEEKNLDLVGCNIVKIDSSGKAETKATTFPFTDRGIRQYLKYNSAIPHPTWLGKAKLFREFKYIDYLACEDYEFLTRIALHGKKMGNLKEVLLKYRNNQNGISNSKKQIQKASLHYVSNCYKKDEPCIFDKYNAYIYGPEGKRKILKIKKYIKRMNNIKQLEKSRPKIVTYICILLLLSTNSSAREFLSIKYHCKKILELEYEN